MLILAGLTLFKMACKETQLHRKRFRKQNHTHPIFFIVILIFLLSKQHKSKYPSSDISSTNMLYLLYKSNQTASKSIKPECTSVRHIEALIYLLLLNDIHPNPGPITQMVSLKCEACKDTTKIITTSRLEKGFEWICPNKNCLPNYHMKPISFQLDQNDITRPVPITKEIHNYHQNIHRIKDTLEPLNQLQRMKLSQMLNWKIYLYLKN